MDTIRLEVTVRRECKQNETTYDEIEICEHDIRLLAEQKSKDLHDDDKSEYTATEVEIMCLVGL